MGMNSKIEWTDATFNPWVGCFKVSPGCKNCYAEELMTRKGRWANTWGPPQTTERIRTSDANWAKPLQWDRQAQKEGKRIKIFCSSLADVFEDNDRLKSWRLDLFMLISDTPNLDWQILTKRPEFAREFFNHHPGFLLPNILIGTSVENQEWADKRIPELLKIPAIRFISVEPLLGSVDLWPWLSNPTIAADYGQDLPLIHWVIVGGESGPNARPMKIQWARQLRDQCQAANVPFFFKQFGEYLPVFNSYTTPDGYNYNKIGKHAAGRLLDGREWNEIPQREVAR